MIELNDASQPGRNFTDEIMRSEFRAQFFSLIPFFIESVRITEANECPAEILPEVLRGEVGALPAGRLPEAARAAFRRRPRIVPAA